MKANKRLALMFMTSLLGSVFVLYSFVHFTLMQDWLGWAVDKSDYATQVYFEVLDSVHQTIVEYGIPMNALDDVFSLENVQLGIQNNMDGIEGLNLEDEIMRSLHDVIDQMDITFTDDVNKGMLELTNQVSDNFTRRTRFPLQETLKTAYKETLVLRWFIWIGLLGLFSLFIRQSSVLTLRHRNIIVYSILGTWLLFVLVWISFVNVSQIQLTPISLKSLIQAIDHYVINWTGIWTFMLSFVLIIRLFIIQANTKRALRHTE